MSMYREGGVDTIRGGRITPRGVGSFYPVMGGFYMAISLRWLSLEIFG